MMTSFRNLRETPFRKSGFTLVEIMVVIVIMGILAGVAVPKLFGLIEKTKEKNDLLHLFYIKKAFERSLVQIEAHDDGSTSSNNDTYGFTGDFADNTIQNYLANSKGRGLILLNINLGDKVNNKGEACYMIGDLKPSSYNNGFYRDILNESGFELVASKLAASSGGTSKIWIPPLFESKTLVYPSSQGGKYSSAQHIRVKWKNNDANSKEVVVWIGGQGDVLTGLQGTVFATEMNGLTTK